MKPPAKCRNRNLQLPAKWLRACWTFDCSLPRIM